MVGKTNKMCSISVQTMKRLPYYLEYLKKMSNEGNKNISAPNVASHFSFNEIQVRKDFASVSQTKGKPKSGFEINQLIENMEEFLGYHNIDEAVLVGVGHLGKALLSYKGFRSYGLKIIAAFDNDEKIVGQEYDDYKIMSSDSISNICRRTKVNIGIITTPAHGAQIACDQLIAGGVKAIWNFAPIYLSVPDNIMVENENMAASLGLLSKHLQKQISEKN